MASLNRSIVQFTPFSSIVQPAFWHELTRIKIDVLRLSEEAMPLTATYALGRTVKDRETGRDVDLGCHITVGGDAFQQDALAPPQAVICKGSFKNFNTIEDFKAADKTAMFNQAANEIWEGITKTGDPSLLNRFLLITFADLKKYKYYYWFAFPAFVAKPSWSIGDPGWTAAEDALGRDVLTSIHASFSSHPRSFFIAKPSESDPGTFEVADLTEFTTFFSKSTPQQQFLGFFDPSASPQHPGWPLRNALAYIRARYLNQGPARIQVICWRDAETPLDGTPWRSRFGVVEVAAEDGEPMQNQARPSAVGWEKNTHGKLGARLADLAPMMDPTRLADQAVDLNLKLMRWRILPALDLERVASTRVLLLGAGTLGCYVARTLLGWGVRNITLLDSATVSFSNPVRQPLFEFTDCLEGGKPKAQCAADALKRIFPGVNAKGISLSIPMPGHPIPPGSESHVRADVAQLEELFDAHDAVFLLMDSRESRWLPTMLGKAKNKIVLNAALGFDTYLVMRHGARDPPDASSALGCYFCNDVVAPADSLTDRTLDQMCTVTRPGLAAIASATAVELLVSILQHSKGAHAPAPPPDFKDNEDEASAAYKSVLGIVPHQLRGFLGQFRTMPIVGAAYDKCTGCSETVMKAYERDGFKILSNVFNEPGYLEQLTGLDKLQAESEAALEAIDWDEDD